MGDINEKLLKFCQNIDELDEMITNLPKLNNELDDQIEVWKELETSTTYSYANASLYWMYLLLKEDKKKLDGHNINNEIERVRNNMRQYILLKQERPKLNIEVAKNFIRHGLWDQTTANNEANNKRKKEEAMAANGGADSNKKSRN